MRTRRALPPRQLTPPLHPPRRTAQADAAVAIEATYRMHAATGGHEEREVSVTAVCLRLFDACVCAVHGAMCGADSARVAGAAWAQARGRGARVGGRGGENGRDGGGGDGGADGRAAVEGGGPGGHQPARGRRGALRSGGGCVPRLRVRINFSCMGARPIRHVHFLCGRPIRHMHFLCGPAGAICLLVCVRRRCAR